MMLLILYFQKEMSVEHSFENSSGLDRFIPPLFPRQSMELNRQKALNKLRLTNYHIPVLFASTEGLHLRVLDREVPVPNNNKDLVSNSFRHS